MSIRLMSAVWDLELPPGEKLVLLALADQANDDGWQCWPAVGTIAKRSGQGERTVFRALRDLEKKGHLTRHQRAGNSTQYHVHPCQNGTPAKSAPLPNAPITPAKSAGKPSRTTNPQKASPSSGRRATVCPSDFHPDPAPGSLTAETTLAWSDDELREQIEHFVDHHTAKGTTSRDWQASWRTWVKNSKKFARDRSGWSDRPSGPIEAMRRWHRRARSGEIDDALRQRHGNGFLDAILDAEFQDLTQPTDIFEEPLP